MFNAENKDVRSTDVVFLRRCACGELLGKPSLHDSVECACGARWLPLLDDHEEQLELKFQELK